MENKEFVGPSGIRLVVRGLKMQEVKLLQNRKSMENGTAFDAVLEACATVIDPGPAYPGGIFNWKTSVLQGDRFMALMMIRCHTHGNEYDFEAKCPDCRKRIPWTVDLTDLKVQHYPEESIRKHVARELFETSLGGKSVKFSLLTCEDEKRILKKINGDDEVDPMMMGLLYRLRDVAGVEFDEREAWLQDVNFGDIVPFRACLDAASGGVNTSITIECKRCGEFEVEIPFAVQGYWFPKKRIAPSSSKL